MIVNYLLLFLSWTFFTSAVRTRRADDEGATLIICDGGEFTVTCPYGTSVNITSAEFGRTSKENICAKTGFTGKDICRSRKALYRAYSFCAAKTRCTMKVDTETLETPVKEDGTGCYDTSIYLRLVYTCVRDCQPPIFNYNSEVVGGEYHVSSTVNVKCRKGYEQVDGQVSGITKTCMDDQTWVGPTLLCRDTDECANPSTNRCHNFALCQNTRGSYSCTCSNGYHGDGVTCTADTWFKSDDWSDADSNKTGTTIDDEWDQALIGVHDEKVCGKRITKGRQGILKSPRTPLNYPSDTTCIWILAVPPGFVVELRFMKFDLEREERNEGCSHDNVTLYDGLNRDPKWWLGTFCGEEIPDTILSQTNKVRIEFRSDQAAQFSGFEIRFSAINLNFACLNFPAPSYNGIIIMNGTRNSTTQPRKSLELGCDVGFALTSSRLVRTCQDNGKWDDFSNPCSPVSCGYPIIPLNEKGLVVKADPKEFRYGQRPVRYECETGYRMVIEQGYDDIIVCDRQGRWSNEVHGVVPSCEEITCVCQTDVTCAANHGDHEPHKALQWKVVDHEGNLVQQPVGRTFSYGSRIEYSCEEGYVISGDDVRLCADDGWSGRRTACEEVPIAGLTTSHIAIIASAASVFVIIVITIVLVICCCRDHKRKKRKRKLNQQRRITAGRDNEGFVMNLALAGNEDFLYGNTVGRRGRKRGFAGRHNNIQQYQSRPHVLPTSGVTHDRSPMETTTPTRQPRPQSVIPRSPQFNVEIRPNGNRTFRPNQHRQSSPQQPNRNRATSSSRDNPRTSSLTKISSPPPGYQDPPPSYETMAREGYNKFDKKRNNRRLI